MSLSNIIRMNKVQPVEKKIIQTKKIEMNKFLDVQSSLRHIANPEQLKQMLISEIDVLEKQYEQLKAEIQKEQEQAKRTIEQWWQDKQEEAEQVAQRLADEATARGYQSGYEQGMLQSENDYQQKSQEIQDLIETAYEERRKIIQQSEPFLLNLSVEIAKKIITEELNQHSDQFLNMVKQALKQVEEYEDIIVHVSPQDYPFILPFIEELENYAGTDSELKLIPVPHVSKGSCMIHTVSGSYDVTISSQLEEIKQQLLIYCEEKTSDELKER